MAGPSGTSLFPPPHNLAVMEARRDGGHSGWLQSPLKLDQEFVTNGGVETKCVHSACMFLQVG